MRKVSKPSRQLNALLSTERTMNPSTPQCSKKTIVNPYTKTQMKVSTNIRLHPIRRRVPVYPNVSVCYKIEYVSSVDNQSKVVK